MARAGSTNETFFLTRRPPKRPFSKTRKVGLGGLFSSVSRKEPHSPPECDQQGAPVGWVSEELSIGGTVQWGHSNNNQCQPTCHMYRKSVFDWAAFGIYLERMCIDIEDVLSG